MTIAEVIALLPRLQARAESPTASQAPSPTKASSARPGERVQKALAEYGNIDGLVGQFRELLVGPAQRLGEARFEELLDILEEQDSHVKRELEALKGEVSETAVSARRLGEICLTMNDRIGEIDTKAHAAREASKLEIKAALMAINEQIDKMAEQLETRFSERLSACARESQRETEALSSALSVHAKRTEEMFVEARDASLTTIEQRIAQWRAEITDERRQDMEQMTDALGDIGQRLINLKHDNKPVELPRAAIAMPRQKTENRPNVPMRRKPRPIVNRFRKK